MGFQAVAWAQKQKCSPTSKLVLLTLASYSDTDGTCWPSHRRLADDCSLTRRAIILHIGILEKQGLLSRVRRKTESGDWDSNVYRLNLSGGSERHSLGVVNQVHEGSERNDRGVVNHVHTNLSVEPVKEPETAASLVNTIKHFEQSKGLSRFIPRFAVVSLGADVVAAYDAVGGAKTFLDPDLKLAFLIRDFGVQLELARGSAILKKAKGLE